MKLTQDIFVVERLNAKGRRYKRPQLYGERAQGQIRPSPAGQVYRFEDEDSALRAGSPFGAGNLWRVLPATITIEIPDLP